jgi:hypothetical protein
MTRLGCALFCLAGACGERAPSDDATPVAASATTVAAATPTVSATPPDPRTAPRPLADVVAVVPEGASSWIAIRDPFALIDGLEWATRGQRDEWALLARAYAPTDVGELVAGLPQIDTRLGGSGVHLDRGLVVARLEGGAVVVIAADTPDDLPRLVRTISGRDTGLGCEPIALHPGFHVCAAEASVRAAYRPRTGVATADADVAALAEIAGIAITVAARDAMLQVDLRGPTLDAGTPRVPTTMAAMAAGSSFLWANEDPAALMERTVPALEDAELVTDVILATSGELLLASPGGPLGVVLISGASKPALLRRLVKRAPELAPWLTALLPGVRVTAESFQFEGRALAVAVAEIDLDDAQRAQLEPFELQARAMLVASDTWLIASLGLGPAALSELLRHPVAPVPEDLLGALPPAMAAALGGGRSTLALHLEFDGLHGPDVRRYLLEAMGRGDFLLRDLERSTALLSLMSAVSSCSLWSEVDDDGAGVTVRIAVRAFGDDRTAEGQAAYTARLNAEDGEDPAFAYGALRDRHGRSGRVHAYVARAGIGGLSTGYPAVANLLMVDAAIRAMRRGSATPSGLGGWLR